MSNGLRSIHTGKMFHDPEMSYSPDGVAMTKFTLPVNTWDGKLKQKGQTLWLQVTTFGKIAESVNMHCHAGTIVCVTGDVQISIYTGRDANNKPVQKVGLQMIPIAVDYIDNYGAASRQETPMEDIEEYKL